MIKYLKYLLKKLSFASYWSDTIDEAAKQHERDKSLDKDWDIRFLDVKK